VLAEGPSEVVAAHRAALIIYNALNECSQLIHDANKREIEKAHPELKK
jgi:hypothetical protein